MYFLNINKPKGKSSFDVIRDLRKILHERSIGHSGTLDPLATGVMQVAVGRATKLLDYLDSDKTYIADMHFGYVSDTFDSEAEIKFIKTPDFSREKLEEVLNSFLGKSHQTPPKYSAIKKNGQKLCDIVRNNPDIQLEIPERLIYIYSIELLDFNGENAKIKVHCKKGTYIRSLVNDIGKLLGCGAYMSELQRIKAGNFDIKNAQNPCDELIKIDPLDALNYEKYELNDEEFQRVKNGNYIKINTNIKGEIVLLTKHNKLVSIAILRDNILKPKKTFALF